MPTDYSFNPNPGARSHEEIADIYETSIRNRMDCENETRHAAENTHSTDNDMESCYANERLARASENEWKGHYDERGVEETTGLNSDLFRQQAEAQKAEELGKESQQVASNTNDVSVSKSASRHL